MITTRLPAGKPRRLKYLRANYQMYLLLIPGVFWLFVYRFLPLIGLTIAFKDFKLFAGPTIFSALVNSRWASANCPCLRCNTPRLFSIAATSR